MLTPNSLKIDADYPWHAMTLLWVKDGYNVWRSSKVLFLEILHALRPDVFIIVEQPANSFMFRLPEFARLIQALNMRRVSTCMGAFGMCLLKPTTLMSTMPCLGMSRLFFKLVDLFWSVL